MESGPSNQAAIPEMIQPPDEESQMYYFSFPTRPRLLGRTSSGTTPWFFNTWPEPNAHYPWGRDSYLPGATAAGPVGNHAIRSKWENGTAAKIVQAIQPLDRTIVNVMRIGRVTTD